MVAIGGDGDSNSGGERVVVGDASYADAAVH